MTRFWFLLKKQEPAPQARGTRTNACTQSVTNRDDTDTGREHRRRDSERNGATGGCLTVGELGPSGPQACSHRVGVNKTWGNSKNIHLC